MLRSALLAFTLLFGACQQQGDVTQTEEGQLVLGAVEVTDEVVRGVAPGQRTLVLDGFNGRVELRGTDAAQASLTFTRHARGSDDAAARRLLQGIDIDESGDETSYRYALRSSRPNVTSVDLTGTVPEGTSVRVELDNGAVLLSGIRGAIEVDVENAPSVQVAGAASDVGIEVLNGAIEIGMAEVPVGAEVRVRNTNGGITFAVPSGADVSIEARTTAGQINTAGLTFDSRRLQPSAAGARFTGQLGTGNAEVDLRTENGTITLREGSLDIPALQPAPELAPIPEDTADPAVAPDVVTDSVSPADEAVVPPPPPLLDDTMEVDTVVIDL